MESHFVTWEKESYNLITYLRINEAIPEVDREVLRRIQSDLMPLGTCCHHYAQRFGTLWSVIYDVTDGALEVCFGSPKVNEWYRFGLDDEGEGPREYTAFLPDAEEQPVWKKLPPGVEDCSEVEE